MKGIILQITVFALGVFLILGSGGTSTNETITPITDPVNDTRRPSTPTGIKAFTSKDRLFVSWDTDPETDALDTYDVCYATERIDEFDDCTAYTEGTLLSTIANVIDFTIVEGIRYYVRVRAKATNGNASIASLNIEVRPSGFGFNDTGIALCGSGDANNLPCPVLGFENQDADNGLDAVAVSNEDGDAGFSFTKLDDNGAELAVSANDWACIKDNVTGFIWEAKTLGNKDDLFKWYSTFSFNNAGSSGDDASGEAICTGFDGANPASFCNTKAYVDRMNADSHCGFSDWGMPSRKELTSIVNYGQVEPAIDVMYFQNTSTAVYWSGTPTFSSSSESDFAWATNFNYGGSAKQNKQETLRVRLISYGIN